MLCYSYAIIYSYINQLKETQTGRPFRFLIRFRYITSRDKLQIKRKRFKYPYRCNNTTFVLTMVMLFPFSRIWSSLVILRPSEVFSYSVTSSSSMLTKSSNPSRVPTISLSFFMIICILEPMHLSTNSVGDETC